MKPEDYGIGTRAMEFRAWSKTDKELVPSYQFEDIGGWEGCCFGDFFGGEEYILMQYTGLKDKNGKEIYEGDVLEGSYVVRYKRDRFMLSCPSPEGGTYDICLAAYAKEQRIIGNIFENEDLLTKENA